MEQKLPVIVQKYISEVAQKYSKKPILLKSKNSSTLMKAIGWFFKITKIGPAFMEEYFTTIGNTIYYPDDLITTMSETAILEVVVHECLHIKDNNKFGVLYPVLYLGPQIFAVVSILSLVAIFASKLWLLWLFAILFLAPIPSFGRYYLEKRAYRTSFVFGKYLYNYEEVGFADLRNWINGQLSTKAYYFALPFPKWVDNDLKNTEFLDTVEYQEIANFIKTNLLGKRV